MENKLAYTQRQTRLLTTSMVGFANIKSIILLFWLFRIGSPVSDENNRFYPPDLYIFIIAIVFFLILRRGMIDCFFRGDSFAKKISIRLSELYFQSTSPLPVFRNLTDDFIVSWEYIYFIQLEIVRIKFIRSLNEIRFCHSLLSICVLNKRRYFEFYCGSFSEIDALFLASPATFSFIIITL